MSYIIPTYNRPHLLARAVRSAAMQTYPHIEIIVVNDGEEWVNIDGSPVSVHRVAREAAADRPFLEVSDLIQTRNPVL